MQRRCARNRKRSKRRAIYCLIHACYLDSVSQKYPLFADCPTQLQQRGVGRRTARLLVASKTTVPLEHEWLEAFWCDQCQETRWYHVTKTGDRTYEIDIAPHELWQQVRVMHPDGNTSVSEFTRRQARRNQYGHLNDFKFMS
ncbi:MAG: hypothetical protein ACFE0I_16065 [Elainellaceae cyanobacterium]